MFCEAMDEPPDHTGPLMNLEDFSFDDCGVSEALNKIVYYNIMILFKVFHIIHAI
jgi:hypothetical protein